MDTPTTSTADTPDVTVTEIKTNDEILHDVATTFWIVFIFYVFASVAWVADLEKLKDSAEKNGVARYLELRRLLKAYDSVDIENLQTVQEEGPERPTEPS
ncbi:unnamed protein product [Nippostrongylus brasiliensis]|uniref:Bap31 domain-containing protein n=1 Tax=Nippostrongylus brasiliensis TaxID=27835 RepID=A0A0N4XWQ1_NIPBR|nr:unnamed protein product [Nippostrongylus brasiliensis]